MNLIALDAELDCLEVALMEATTMKEWDTAIHRYNALKIDRCHITGDPITSVSISTEHKQLLNIRNHG
ncbi:hypothetical protein M2451_003343 [Dysgonomonas sp. PFB1-18]|uniref:hypothetical protein n=1 Tax=unclassified Dysgonomonas TaxID=2630389 RepID=UPI002473BDAA|nr:MULTISPECIES: hypothetical protein [unclassified Dysgonomonas]MDH6310567.1 hypothetical protein [Dysgonomonas sp. PF1-14]MDH6340417.1 hypothetical protein [Dysgonomonas sp. PF1-16]MDH6382003.1 hypothetical protein [Dysgonomonas sp. PFB1-18]MDH6399388.1 hypothetical protein [Dysgonomonas sp. PF1-23]